MKQLAAIVFSLLLIVAQTFAVTTSVSSGISAEKPDCCCDECRCCVSESGTPAAPPLESTAPTAAAHNQFLFTPVTRVSFTLAVPSEDFFPAIAPTEFRPATLPIFQRNCSFLI